MSDNPRVHFISARPPKRENRTKQKTDLLDGVD